MLRRMRSIATVIVILGGCGFTGGATSEAPLDAPVLVDAPDASAVVDGANPVMPFDPAKCPAGFVAVGALPHRYRWVFDYDFTDSWDEAYDRCDAIADGAYRAHLVVFQSVAERDEVRAAYGPPNGWQWFWTGVTATTPGWITIFGSSYVPAFGDGTVANDTMSKERGIAVGQSQTGSTAGDLSIDLAWGLRTVCECDGAIGMRP